MQDTFNGIVTALLAIIGWLLIAVPAVGLCWLAKHIENQWISTPLAIAAFPATILWGYFFLIRKH
jgi:hypothetical protein